ncbi:MAG: hypothetical protein AAGD09_15255 [Cyanobacteria bacterium P01_F01_bin.56]
MKTLVSVCSALAGLLITPLVAEAARLSLNGRVALTSANPIENARITVTFHGHEMGIHEYTTQRWARIRTNNEGEFNAIVKVPDDRYIWTHATIEIAETDLSKATTVIAPCEIDDQGGGHCSKEFRVSPLIIP